MTQSGHSNACAGLTSGAEKLWRARNHAGMPTSPADTHP